MCDIYLQICFKASYININLLSLNTKNKYKILNYFELNYFFLIFFR